MTVGGFQKTVGPKQNNKTHKGGNKMAVKFMTIKGASTIATKPFYIGIPQHERVIGKKEAYEIAAERTSSRSRLKFEV